jgi:alpha-D-ribose 1-methylphosphonate 5-triphosphate synthase subunit PhnL
MKITSSSAKLREWQRIRALDVRAAALMKTGVEREAAYVRAMDEVESRGDDVHGNRKAEAATKVLR